MGLEGNASKSQHLCKYRYREGRGTRLTTWAPKGEEPWPNANEREPHETQPHETGFRHNHAGQPRRPSNRQLRTTSFNISQYLCKYHDRERRGKGLPAGNKTRCKRTDTAQSKATKRNAKPNQNSKLRHGAQNRPKAPRPRAQQDRASGSGQRPTSRRTRPAHTGPRAADPRGAGRTPAGHARGFGRGGARRAPGDQRPGAAL
jgi:hypothetical protein